jgi:hypothetical protein
MVLVYLPTKLGDFVSANFDKYSSTMDHMGLINFSNPIPHSKKEQHPSYGPNSVVSFPTS